MNRYRVRAVFAACIVALCAAAPASALARTFEPVGSANGLEARVVPSILVDREGFLWIGAREGLSRYDGYEAISYAPDAGDPDAISDLDIRVLHEASDGDIWIGTNTGGLNRFDPATRTFEVFRHDSADPSSLLDDAVYGLSEGPNGFIWVASNKGLSRLNKSTGLFEHFYHDPEDPQSLSHSWAYQVYLSNAANLWIGTVGGGISHWQPQAGEFKRYDLAAMVGGLEKTNDVFALHEDDQGILWAGTRDGLVRLDPAAGEARTVDLGVQDGFRPVITSMLAYEGRLWLGTMTRGILIVDMEKETWDTASRKSLGAEGYLPAQPQMSLASDGRLLFVGTWGSGVYRAPIDRERFTLFNNQVASGLANNTISAVLAMDEPGRPWVGSFGGGPQRVNLDRMDTETNAPRGQPLRESGVWDIARTADGRSFAATTHGLYEFDDAGSQLRLFAHDPDDDNSIAAGYATSLLPAGGSNLWVGVSGGGLSYFDAATGHFTHFLHDPDRPDSPSGDSITSLLQDDVDHIWVGTRSNGLNLCNTVEISCRRFSGATAEEGALGHFHITALFRDRRGRVWVGTDGGGLNLVVRDDQGQVSGFRHWRRENGLLSDSIMAVEEDLDESLWLSTRHGLSRLNPATGNVVNHITASGLPTSHFNANASAADEHYIYFGSVDGLLASEKGSLLATRQPSVVRITSVETMSRGGTARISQLVDKAITVPYGDIVTIEMATLDYSESAHEYAYRMNADEPWIELGSQRQIIFYGLSSGTYDFQARGRDVYGLVDESAVLKLEIVPPVWKSGWFRALMAALLVALGVVGHLGRQRALKRRSDELLRLGVARERALEDQLGGQAELAVLTPRQKEILQLMAEGNSTRDIAELLDVSIKTVQAHRANLMERLDIEDLAGLVRLAVRTRLVSPHE